MAGNLESPYPRTFEEVTGQLYDIITDPKVQQAIGHDPESDPSTDVSHEPFPNDTSWC
jgi:hypothetical protein